MTKFALKSHALRNLEARDNASLDLLAGLSGGFARSPVLPSGLIEVRNKSVALDGCRLDCRLETFEGFSRLFDLVNQGRAFIYHVISRYRWGDRACLPFYRSEELARIVLGLAEHEDSHSCPACLCRGDTWIRLATESFVRITLGMKNEVSGR